MLYYKQNRGKGRGDVPQKDYPEPNDSTSPATYPSTESDPLSQLLGTLGPYLAILLRLLGAGLSRTHRADLLRRFTYLRFSYETAYQFDPAAASFLTNKIFLYGRGLLSFSY